MRCVSLINYWTPRHSLLYALPIRAIHLVSQNRMMRIQPQRLQRSHCCALLSFDRLHTAPLIEFPASHCWVWDGLVRGVSAENVFNGASRLRGMSLINGRRGVKWDNELSTSCCGSQTFHSAAHCNNWDSRLIMLCALSLLAAQWLANATRVSLISFADPSV